MVYRTSQADFTGGGAQVMRRSWIRRLRAQVAAAVALATVSGCAAKPAPTAGANPGQYAEVNGIRVYYEVHGAGPVLVLLHGGAGNGEQFSRQVPAFEK